jgi:hypothetical protein
MVFPETDIETRMELGPPLADDDAARLHRLAAKGLDAKILGIAVSPISGGTAAFLRGHLNSFDLRARDIGNPELCEALAVSLRAAIVLASLFLEHHDRARPPLLNDLGLDPPALDPRPSDRQAAIVLNETNLGQLDDAAHLTGQRFYPEERAGLDPVLFSSGFDYRVHGSLLERDLAF